MAYVDTTDLAGTGAGQGAAMVGFKNAGAGTVARTAQDKLVEAAVTPADFDTTGVLDNPAADHSDVLNAFFQHCVANNVTGYIPAGTYRVRWGVIELNCDVTRRPFPTIMTAGHQAVIFQGLETTTPLNDKPMISIVNWGAEDPTANPNDFVTQDRTWMGGALGGFTVQGANGSNDAVNRHALMLSGVYQMQFGTIAGQDLQGSTVMIPAAFTHDAVPYNPDPFHVGGCRFAGILGARNRRYTLENRGSLALNGCTIDYLRCVNNLLGGWFGLGGGNLLLATSMSSLAGWAFDDGHQEHAHGGVAHNVRVLTGELDDCQNGFRLNRAKYCRFEQQRIIHRNNVARGIPKPPLLPSEEGYPGIDTDFDWAEQGFWPRRAVLLGSLASPTDAEPTNTFRNYFEIEHRIDGPGGTLSDIGRFTDFNHVVEEGEVVSNTAGAQTEIEVDLRLQDNVGYAIPRSWFWTNLHPSSQVRIRFNGLPIVDQMPRQLVLARMSEAVSVPNAGFLSDTSRIVFDSELADPAGAYNPSTGKWTAPFTGYARFTAQLALSGISAQYCRMAIMREDDSGMHAATELVSLAIQNTSGVQHHRLEGILPVVGGRMYYLSAAQTSGSAVNTTCLGAFGENFLQVEMI